MMTDVHLCVNYPLKSHFKMNECHCNAYKIPNQVSFTVKDNTGTLSKQNIA